MVVFSAEEIYKIPGALLPWYDQNKRQMAWREHPSPYRTWISEIMLQQTRVEAVHGYFARWMQALPTLNDLAAADQELLNKLWEGLGYYSRVRNLKKAAEIVVKDFGGFLPSDPALLQKLPGIGAYTAGAICSIAFGKPVAAVDGNVIRVFARLLDIREDFSDNKGKKSLAAAIEPAMPHDKCSDFTQALMELGALICIPGHPRCELCPLNHMCRGFQNGSADRLPVLPLKKQKAVENMTVCVIKDRDGHYLLHKRPSKGLLAGLWEPWHTAGHLNEMQIRDALKNVTQIQKNTQYTHVFTHVKWVMHGYTAVLGSIPQGFQAVSPDELQTKYAIPKAFSVFFRRSENETQKY